MTEINDDDGTARLAATLQAVRVSRGLSANALAELSGVSRAMIGKIERGEAQPTAALLGRLIGPLDLTMSELFAQVEASPERLARRAGQPLWTDPGTGYRRRAVSPPGGHFQLVEVELPPGRTVSYPPDPFARTHHQIWVLDGHLRFREGDVDHELATGDCLELGPPQACSYTNPTEHPCRYLVALTRQPLPQGLDPARAVRVHGRSMTDWTTVDHYLADTLLTEDDALREARRATADSSMPSAEVTPAQGALLALLARISGARRVLEIGTLTGYSTIWLARAAEHVTTLELDPTNAELARRHLRAAGVADRVDLRVGPAADTLATLTGSYDLVFIDADKPSNPLYLREALRLSHPGTIIFADNVVRDGAVTDPRSADPRVRGVRRFFEMAAADPRLHGTALQTVGSKGWDGFALLRVEAAEAPLRLRPAGT